MKRLLLLLCCLAAATAAAPAQKHGHALIDSLRSRLNDASAADTTRVRLLGALSFQYFKFDTDSGIYFGEQALSLAQELHWGTGIAFANNYLGTNYAVKGNYPKALEYFSKSLATYTEINDRQGIAFLSNNLGNFFRMQEEYEKAIRFVNAAVAINKELNNQADLVKNYNNLGFIYSRMNDLARSNENYHAALKIARETGNKELTATLLSNLAENKMKLGDFCGALEFGLSAVRLAEEMHVTYDAAVYTSLVGEIYLRLAEHPDERCTVNCPDPVRGREKDLLSAKTYLVRALALLEKVADLAEISQTSLLLSQVYEKLGDARSALAYFKRYSAARDSVYSQDNAIRLANIEKKREIELRDKQIIIQQLELERKNMQIIGQIILFALILLLTSLIPYLYYKKQKRQKEMKAEQERKALEQQLIQAQKLEGIGTLAGGIAHDFNNLLAMILGAAELMRMKAQDRPELQRYADRIIEMSERGTSISRQLLIFSRPGEAELKPVSVAGIIGELKQMLKHFLPKTITIMTETPPSGPDMIKGDTGQIHQALLNLAINAGDAMTNAGTLTIRQHHVPSSLIASRFGPDAEAAPLYCAVSVTDTGRGMDAELIGKIFEPFFSTKERGKGTGLGLAMVHGIVRNHGGFIDVDSTPGAGTTFTLYFPALEPASGHVHGL